MTKTVDVAWTFSFSTNVKVEIPDGMADDDAESYAMEEADKQMRYLSLSNILNHLGLGGDYPADEFETTDVN